MLLTLSQYLDVMTFMLVRTKLLLVLRIGAKFRYAGSLPHGGPGLLVLRSTAVHLLQKQFFEAKVVFHTFARC
jgi:hypothetical protein